MYWHSFHAFNFFFQFFSCKRKEKKKTGTLNCVTQMSTNERKIRGGGGGSYIPLLHQSLEFHYRDDWSGGWGGMGGGVHESCREQNTTGKKTLLQPDVLSCDGGIITSATKQVNSDTGRPVTVATVPKGISLPSTQSYSYSSNCSIHTVSWAFLEL